MKRFLTVEINKNRIYGLDILRAIAILFVVIGHGMWLLPKETYEYHKVFVFDGVSLFFVLSGFLIGGILIKLLDKNTASLPLLVNFWIRRWFRTLPNYFLILFVLYALNVIYNEGFSLNSIKSYFIFSQNLFTPHPYFFPEAWSLSAEEWFYLTTPVLIFALIWLFKIPSKKAVLLVAGTLLVATMIYRFAKFSALDISTAHEWDELFRKQVFTRLDSLMYGVLCAYIKYYAEAAWIAHKRLLLYIGLFLFLLVKALFLAKVFPYGGLYSSVFSFSVESLATALLLPYLSDLKKGSGKLHSSITLISLVSYSMYLLHLTIIQVHVVDKLFSETWIANAALSSLVQYTLYWTLTIVGAILLYKYFEIPTTKLRDHEKIKRVLVKLENDTNKVS